MPRRKSGDFRYVRFSLSILVLATRHSMTENAIAIWKAALEAVRPRVLFTRWLDENPSWQQRINTAERILIVGAGKAGAAMSEAFEECFAAVLSRVEGIVNVPAESVRPLQRIKLHPARPAGSNHPTEDGVAAPKRCFTCFPRLGRATWPYA